MVVHGGVAGGGQMVVHGGAEERGQMVVHGRLTGGKGRPSPWQLFMTGTYKEGRRPVSTNLSANIRTRESMEREIEKRKKAEADAAAAEQRRRDVLEVGKTADVRSQEQQVRPAPRHVTRDQT